MTLKNLGKTKNIFVALLVLATSLFRPTGVLAQSGGFYSVPGLFAGNYTLTFSAPGMKKYQTSLTLQDAQNAVLNPQLSVGDVAEQVTVSGEAVQSVTYDSGTVSTAL